MPKSSWLFIILIVGLIALTRLWNIAGLPPSPYEEEAALGYDAYSIYKTGKDHHGNPYPILALQSFGDWKPAFYAYASIPFIAVLDLGVLAVRLPSALSGVVIVLNVILLAKFLGISRRWAGLVAAASPWLIFFSRAAWEVNLATALIASAMTLFFWQSRWKSTKKRILAMFAIGLLLTASAYTYHSARLIVPLLVPGMLAWTVWSEKISFKSLGKKLASLSGKLTLGISLLVFLGILPLLLNARQPMVAQRVMETSYIGTDTLLSRSLLLQESAGNTSLSKKIFHPYVVYGQEFVKNYLVHLDPRFLFFDGDPNPRHSSGHTALFYWFDALILVLGVIWLRQYFGKNVALLAWWLAVALVPAALTKDVPHALRILPAAPVFMLILAAGYQFVVSYLDAQKWSFKLAAFVGITLILGQFLFFWWHYTKIYPQQFAGVWHYGMEEIVRQSNEYLARDPAHHVYLGESLNRPMMFYWFYSKTDPTQVQAVAKNFSGAVKEFGHITVGQPTEFPALYAKDFKTIYEL